MLIAGEYEVAGVQQLALARWKIVLCSIEGLPELGARHCLGRSFRRYLHLTPGVDVYVISKAGIWSYESYLGFDKSTTTQTGASELAKELSRSYRCSGYLCFRPGYQVQTREYLLERGGCYQHARLDQSKCSLEGIHQITGVLQYHNVQVPRQVAWPIIEFYDPLP